MRITERKLRSIIRQVIMESTSVMSEDDPLYEDVGNAINEICDIVIEQTDFYNLKEKTQPEPGSVMQEDPKVYAQNIIKNKVPINVMMYLMKNEPFAKMKENERKIHQNYIEEKVIDKLYKMLDRDVFRSGDAYDSEQEYLKLLNKMR